MKTAIIAVSRDGLNIGKRLIALYPQAAIYAPPRLIAEDHLHDDSVVSAKIEQDVTVVFQEGDKCVKPFSSEENTRKNSLPLEEYVHKNSLPLEGGGSGWGCDVELTLHPLEGNFKAAIAGLFNKYKLMVFISAAAVAVRAIAPCLQGKEKDPAVVVINDQGRFAISLLSGHLGGANEETVKIAAHLGAQPVITTATDNRGVTAFDDLTRTLGWKIENLPDLKKISAALIEEREIYLYSKRTFHHPLSDNIKIVYNPEDLQSAVNGYVLISSHLDPLPDCPSFPHIILRPLSIAAGVGCRRGTPAGSIIKAVENTFTKARLSLSSLSCLATGEFKADEKGLNEAAALLGVPIKIFKRDEIAASLGDSPLSTFVEKQVGVGAVAEPCARLGSGGGPLLLEVQKDEGITVALAESPIYTAREG